MLFSIFEAYAPNLKFTYCELAPVSLLTLLVCQHVYPPTIKRDIVTLIISV